MNPSPTSADAENPPADVPHQPAAFKFSEKSIRHAFIRKVYAILVAQLAVTVGFIALFMYEPHINEFVQEHEVPFWVLFGVALGLMVIVFIVIACVTKARRTWPWNLVLLGVFTICISFFVAVVTSGYNREEVLIAIGVCAVVCLGLTIFALQTKWDFTTWGGILFVFLLDLTLFGILAGCMQSKVLNMLYACLGALLFCFYIVYDTQMMLGGKHSYSISPEEYIFAALILYLDIINLFLRILAIIGGGGRSNS